MLLTHSTMVFLSPILFCLLGTVVANPPTVDLGYVKYYGSYNATSGINYFRGIPYAQPPLGDLRWRKTRPIEANNSFNGQNMSAVNPAPACYQVTPPAFPVAFRSPFAQYNQSEDCLILDVLVPAQPVSTALPVMVQIHGGGYVVGDAGYFPGDALVHASQGKIIYVSIQYRLGFFGFLAGSEVMSNGEANAGLLDQRTALDWIQRNIARFGGDPSKVTITGASAGGGSVTLQLIAGGAVDNPPFRAAIPEYPWWQPLMNSSSQELQYATVLQQANCSDLSCLRSLSSDELNQVSSLATNVSYPSPGYGYGLYAWGPVVDGKFIRQLPDQAFKQGNFYKVPTLIDHNAYEGVPFTSPNLTTSQAIETMDAGISFPFAGPSFFSRLYQLYPAIAYNSTFYQRAAWFGDFVVTCPTYYMATAMTDRNYNSSAVFKLVFAAGSQLHGATLPFVFSSDINYPGVNRTIADILSSHFISFVVTLDPNPLRNSNATFWPSYNSLGGSEAGEADGFGVLSITTNSISAENDPDARPQCDFFSSQGYVVSN